MKTNDSRLADTTTLSSTQAMPIQSKTAARQVLIASLGAALLSASMWLMLPTRQVETPTLLRLQSAAPVQPAKPVERLTAAQMANQRVIMTTQPEQPLLTVVDEKGKVIQQIPENAVDANGKLDPVKLAAFKADQVSKASESQKPKFDPWAKVVPDSAAPLTAEAEQQQTAAEQASTEAMRRLLVGEDASGLASASAGAAQSKSAAAPAKATGLETARLAVLSLATAAQNSGAAKSTNPTDASTQLLRAKQSIVALHAELELAYQQDRDLLKRTGSQGFNSRVDAQQAAQHGKLKQLTVLLDQAQLELSKTNPNSNTQRMQAEVMAQLLESLSMQTPAVTLGANPLPVSRPKFTARALPTGTGITPSYAKASTDAAVPADLIASDLTALDATIIAKASALKQNYVEIFDFVRTQIRSQAYAGAQKNAADVLRTGTGNAADQASLLIALLRAAKTPTRYVHGVVSLPRAKLAATLMIAPEHLERALTAAGMAFEIDASAGASNGHFKIEHTWVSALVPYALYRGSIAAVGDAIWVPLDSFIKPHSITASKKPMQLANLTGTAFVQSWLNGAQSTDPVAALNTQLSTALSALVPAQSLASATGIGVLSIDPLDVLPSALPSKEIIVLSESAALPSAHIANARIQLQAADNASVMDATISIHQLRQKRTYLSYIGATPEDANLILANAGLANTPPYLLKVRPLLKNFTGTIASGTRGIDAGAALKLTLTLTSPAGAISLEQQVLSGAAMGVYIASAGDAPTYSANLLDPLPAGGNTAEEAEKIGRLLWNFGQYYAHRWDEGDQKLGDLLDITPIAPFPQVLLIHNQLVPEVVQGRVASLSWRGVAMDAMLRMREPISRIADRTAEPDWLQISALSGSYHERYEFYRQWGAEAVSADWGFKLARTANIPIRDLQAGDSLTTLVHDPAVMAQVQAALTAGLRVQIPDRIVTQGIWSGSNWRVYSPITGETGYFVSGRYAGGVTSTPPNLWYYTAASDVLSSNGSATGADSYAEALVIYAPSQGQIGTVGQALARPFEVLAVDRYGRVVPGVNIKFQMTSGLGFFQSNNLNNVTVKTDGTGKVRAGFTLGTDFSKLPYTTLPGTPNPIRAGVIEIYVTASVYTPNGYTTLRTGAPIRAYVKSGEAVRFEHGLDISQASTYTLTNGTQEVRRTPFIRSFYYRGWVRALDQYGNRVSNVDIALNTPRPSVPHQDQSFSFNGGLFSILSIDNSSSPGKCPAQTIALETKNCLQQSIQVQTGVDDTEYYYVTPGHGFSPYLMTKMNEKSSIELSSLGLTERLIIEARPTWYYEHFFNSVAWVQTPSGPMMGKFGRKLIPTSGFAGIFRERIQVSVSQYRSVETLLMGSNVVLNKRLDHVEGHGSSLCPLHDFNPPLIKAGPCESSPGSSESYSVFSGAIGPGGACVADTTPYEVTDGTHVSGSPTFPGLTNGRRFDLTNSAWLYEAVGSINLPIQAKGLGAISAKVKANYSCRANEAHPNFSPPALPPIKGGFELIADSINSIAPNLTPTPNNVRLDGFGNLLNNIFIQANEAGNAYVGRSELTLFENGVARITAEAPASVLSGLGFGLPSGFTMDPNKTYTIGLRINIGTPLEQSLRPVPLNVRADIITGYGVFPTEDVPLSLENYANANVLIEDEVNVVEGDMCRSAQVLAVHVGSPARISVKLQGKNVFGVPAGPMTTIVENELSAIGVSKILMGNTNFADGNYEMTISAQSVANTARTDRVVGTVTRRTKRLDLRSLAHTEVQGVDLFSGGFSAVETDIPHFGRGPELALNRSYSSHSGDQLGAFGRGWFSGAEQRIRFDSCGRVQVIGSGGQGQVFATTGQLDGEGWALYRPLHGYHGTLRQRAQTYEFFAVDGTRYVYAEPHVSGPKLSYVEDTNGNRVTAAYQLLGGEKRMTSLTGSGRTLSLTYTETPIVTELGEFGGPSNAWLVTKASGDSTVIDYSYDSYGNLKTSKQSSGTNLGFSRSYAVRNLGSIVMGLNERSIRLGFRLESITDVTREVSKRISYVIATSKLSTEPLWEARVSELQQADGGLWKFGYLGLRGQTPSAELVILTDVLNPRSINTRYELNRFGATIKQTDPLGSVQTSWDLAHRKPSSTTDRLGRTRSFSYDNFGNTLSEAFAGRTTRFTYAANTAFTKPYIRNRPLSSTDALSVATSFTYDPSGNLSTSTKAGVSEAMTYAANGDLKTRSTGRGDAWLFDYTSNGLLSKQTDPQGGIQLYYYTAQGRKYYVTDEANKNTSWTFDLQGRVLTEATPDGTETRVYSDLSRSWEVTNRRAFKTKYEADAMGRVLKITYPNASIEEFTYDANGNRLTAKDRVGTVTTTTFDDLDRQLSTKRGELTNTRTLDLEGRVLTEVAASTTPAATRTTSYTYDNTNDGWLTEIRAGIAITTRTFDANGNVKTQTDPLGRVTTLIYDDRNRVTQKQEPLGMISTFTYDANDQVLTENRTGGYVRTYTRDKMNRVLTDTDSLGKVATSIYDLRGLRTKYTDRRGGVTSTEYEGMRRVSKIIAPLARETWNYYDGSGNLNRQYLPNGNQINRVFNNMEHLQSETDSVGVVRKTTFDVMGRLLSETRDGVGGSFTTTYFVDALGRTTVIYPPARDTVTQTWNGFDELIERKDNRTAISYQYDALGRKTEQSQTDSNYVAQAPPAEIQRWTYDANGNVLTQTDAKGQVTTMVYDARNQLIEQQDPAPLTTKQTWTYNAQDELVSQTDRRGLISTFTYDTEHRKLTSKRNAILMETLTYDGEGAVLSQTDARGNVTAFEYDAAGRKIKVTLAPITAGDAAQIMSWTYTLGDQVASHIDASAKTRTYTYNARNRKLTEVDGLNQTTTMAYDLRDLVTRKNPPNGKYASFKYDGAGALIEYKDWNDKLTTYQYDVQGNRTQMTDALMRVTNWTYGRANRLQSHKLPYAIPGRSYVYDLNGNLTSETTENGAVLANTYDALNRKVGMSSSSTAAAQTGEVVSTAYALDGNGNILTITETLADNSVKTETRTYDVEGRLTSVTDRNGKARSYAYDAADNRTSETDHESIAVTHAYDARNRLASTTSPELGVTSYLYDGAGRLLETSYANLAKEVRAYDLAGQLISLKHERAGGTLHSELYEYDASGNRKKLTQNDGTTTRVTTYTVDHADRLLTEVNPDERLEDTLDVVGNRTQRLVKNGTGTLVKTITYTINARDQVTQVQEKNAAGVVTSTEIYGFDANGNRISKVNGAVTTTYLYDRRNRQLGSGTSRFELNDGDVRTARIEGGNRTEMVMQGLKLQAEITGGVTAAKYRWGLQLIGEKRGGLVKTILQDSLRSPLIIADQTGAISDRVRYTAAGEVRQRSGSSPIAFGFGGYLTNTGTDELYAFARTYAPGMGRFNENDPLRTFDPMMGMGLHRYVLGYGNSIRYVDPDGRIGIFFDGTWNDRNDPATIKNNARTNVSELHDRYRGLRFYKEGIGTDWYTKHPCGLTGCGLNARVDMAYERISQVYSNPNATAEDKTIDIFGYSRGAAQSRALVSKLLEDGIPVTTIVERYEHSADGTGGRWVKDKQIRWEKPNIRFVGLMDTVPARGVPLDPGLAYFDLLEGYRQNLDFTKVGSVRHAVAAEEFRTTFDLQSIRGCPRCVLPDNAEEVYFRGSHGNVGGGVGDSFGSDLPAFIPLAYLHREAREAGVPFAEDKALESLVGTAVFHWDDLSALIYDSKYLYEQLTDRRARTTYYDSGSEDLSEEEMLRRAYEQAQQEARVVVEEKDASVKSEPPK